MANYWSAIPAEVPSQAVFEAINSRTVDGMDGIAVSAFGDHGMAEYFNPASDEIFKFCQSQREICEKVAAGSTIGNLYIQSATEQIAIFKPYKPTIPEDDTSIPTTNTYDVRITLINADEFGMEEAILKSYEDRLGILAPVSGNRFTMSYGETKDVALFYQIRCVNLCKFLEIYEVENSREWLGDIQEKSQIKENPVDSSHHPSCHPYSVYSNSLKNVCNYPISTKERFCSMLDGCPLNLRLSVGRRFLSFKTDDGRQTRTLYGNQFDIHHFKGKRKLSISFEQFSDEDIPVRKFSGEVRKSLKQLGIKI
ncbi:MAG: hypothetical protein K0Q55_3967 [Verrucomicrobia bacterium]|jgi:hypothetical protein|nr:hypothetical protein [Verrucomicrobiota bacterium]